MMYLDAIKAVGLSRSSISDLVGNMKLVYDRTDYVKVLVHTQE